MLMLFNRLIWPEKTFFLINNCLFKSSLLCYHYSDEVLFHPPRGANLQKTIFSQAAQIAASET